MNTSQIVTVDLDFPDVSLRVAIAAYLARYKGASRLHTESDLRCYLTWCRNHDLDPLQARRPHIELYLRWMQEIQRFNPPRSPGGSRSWPASTAPASSTPSSSTRRPSTCAHPGSQPTRPHSG